MKNKTEFILTALNDCQATIRSIDTKIGVLLAGLLIPFSLLGKIWGHLQNVSSKSCLTVAIILGIIFFLLWIGAVIALIRGIAALDNPANHIVNSNNFKGTFYSGGLYSFEFLDIIVNRKIIKAERDVEHQLMQYPDDQESINKELTLEHMKLIYIRDIKIHRLNNALKMTFLWGVLGVLIYVFSKCC